MIDGNALSQWADHADLIVKALKGQDVALQQQGAEIRDLKANLARTQKSLDAAQALNAKQSEAAEAAAQRYAELAAENKRLAAEAREACRRCETMESHPEVREARSKRARAEAAKLLAEAERLKPTEKAE